MDRDGGRLRQLAHRRGNEFPTAGTSSHIERHILPWHTFMPGQRGAQDSDEVFVTSYKLDDDNGLQTVNLLRLGTIAAAPRPYPGRAR